MFQENSQFLFLKKHLSKLLIGFVVFCFSIYWVEKKWHANKHEIKQINFLAEQLLSPKDQMISKESFEKIGDLLRKKPYLKPKYHTAYELALLSQHQEQKALTLMKESLHSSLPEELAKFNKISYILTEKKIDEAFDLSLEYEKCFANAEYPSLRLHHLLRLFFLAEKKGDILCKQVTFEKIATHPLWPEIESLFSQGTLSLKDFL